MRTGVRWAMKENSKLTACGVINPEFIFWKGVESVGALNTFLPFENITIGFIDLFTNCSGEGIKESASGTSIILSFSVSEGSLN